MEEEEIQFEDCGLICNENGYLQTEGNYVLLKNQKSGEILKANLNDVAEFFDIQVETVYIRGHCTRRNKSTEKTLPFCEIAPHKNYYCFMDQASDDITDNTDANQVDGLQTSSDCKNSNNSNVNDSLSASVTRKVIGRDNWKRNVRKKCRNLGQEYVNSKNVRTPARTIQPRRCKEKRCKFDCSQIQEDQRLKIFSNYWKLGSRDLQWSFITQCITPLKLRNRKTTTNSSGSRKKRSGNNAYHFQVNENKIRVCKHFFISTLSINNSVIENIHKKTTVGDQRGRHQNRKTIPESVVTDIKNHIASIPRVKPYQLTKNQANESPKPEYISGNSTVYGLYREYLQKHKSSSERCGTYLNYRNIFKKSNIKILDIKLIVKLDTTPK